MNLGVRHIHLHIRSIVVVIKRLSIAAALVAGGLSTQVLVPAAKAPTASYDVGSPARTEHPRTQRHCAPAPTSDRVVNGKDTRTEADGSTDDTITTRNNRINGASC